MEFIFQTWHWAVSGFLISVVMLLLILMGKRFGVSSSFRTLCNIGGAGKSIKYFDFNWKEHSWLLLFVIGSILGGTVSKIFLANPEPVRISEKTEQVLKGYGIDAPKNIEEGDGFLPAAIFNFNSLLGIKGILLMIFGGFCIGFGTRWAGGCTSGHAISGLSNLQLPSLVAVIGFFIGGLLSTHFLIPLILKL